MEISETDYEELCKVFPIFKKVKFKYFEPKIWLIFLALTSGKINAQTISSRPCQSLMEHDITFDQIEEFLNELKKNEVFTSDSSNSYRIIPEVAYELHRVCYKMTKKIEESNEAFIEILDECGYPMHEANRRRVDMFTSGDANAKSETLKDLLSQLAYAGAKLLIKSLVRLEEKLD